MWSSRCAIPRLRPKKRWPNAASAPRCTTRSAISRLSSSSVCSRAPRGSSYVRSGKSSAWTSAGSRRSSSGPFEHFRGRCVGEQVAIDPCPSLGDLVLAADGGLSPSHKTSMMAHLRQCAACRDRLNQANAFLEASADVEAADGAVEISSSGSVSVAAMAIGLDEELGAEYDSEAKTESRN